MSTTVVGLFDQYKQAEQAVHELRAAEFPPAQISFVVNDPTGEYASELNFDPSRGAVTGAGAGAAVGGLAGVLLGFAAMAVPGIGPVLAAGPFAGLLTGAGFGAVAGGILGAFEHMGVSVPDAQHYAEAVRRGGTLVVIKTVAERVDEAAAIMKRCGAADINERVAQWRREGWTAFNPEAESSRRAS